MYSFDARIRYSECDRTGRLSWEGLLNLFQDCSTFQSEELGVGVQYLLEHKRAWVLNYWQIEVNRFPAIMEDTEVSTIPYEIGGFFGRRNFVLRAKSETASGAEPAQRPEGMKAAGEPEADEAVSAAEAGHRPEGIKEEAPAYMRINDAGSLAYADSLWTFLDLESKKPARVTEPWLSAYQTSERIPMKYGPRKIKTPAVMTPVSAQNILRHHLDTNGHVNNARYVLMAFDAIDEYCLAEGRAFPEDRIRSLRVEYRKAAYLGDTIMMRVHAGEEIFVVSMEDEAGSVYATLEAKLG